MLQLGVTGLGLLIWVFGEKATARLCAVLQATGRRGRDDKVWRHMSVTLMSTSAFIVLAGIALLALSSVAGLWRYKQKLNNNFTIKE